MSIIQIPLYQKATEALSLAMQHIGKAMAKEASTTEGTPVAPSESGDAPSEEIPATGTVHVV